MSTIRRDIDEILGYKELYNNIREKIIDLCFTLHLKNRNSE